MTDESVVSLFEDLVLYQDDTTKQLSLLDKLNAKLNETEIFNQEDDLRNILINYLSDINVDIQKSALCILITCLKKKLFNNNNGSDMAQIIVDIAYNTSTENVEYQELWLKAFTALELMDTLHTELYTKCSLRMLKILQKAFGSVCSSVQKLNALKMMRELFKIIDIDSQKDLLIPFWLEIICPLMFNTNNQSAQLAALNISDTLFVMLQDTLLPNDYYFNSFSNDIQEKYIPVMTNLINKGNCFYSKLWSFLTRLLGIKFHQRGFTIVNLLLSVVETAFRAQSVDVRLEAFYCWQVLIDSFTQNPNSFLNEKRLQLLTIPIKSNNCKTEKLIEIKFFTWCKLINALYEKRINWTADGILEQFLKFCFGPLSPNQCLLSYNPHCIGPISQGKRYPSIHIMSSRAFLQLLGDRKYIDNELYAKLELLNYFSADGPRITNKEFCLYSKLIIDSVGECCVMLTLSDHVDSLECTNINNALWKSLFHIIDLLEDEEVKQKSMEELSALIITLIGVARKKTNLIMYALVPLFNIITSNKFNFFKHENMTELLFLPMVTAVIKKNKALLLPSVAQIFKKIFAYKRDEPDFLNFIQIASERFSLILNDNITLDKFNTLHDIWCILEDELRHCLQSKKNVDKDEFLSVFVIFFVWPISTLPLCSKREDLLTKWKNLYALFGDRTSQVMKNKLAINILDNMHAVLLKELSPEIAELKKYIIFNLKYSSKLQENIDISVTYSFLRTILSILTSPSIYKEQLRTCFKSMSEVICIQNFCLAELMERLWNCLIVIFDKPKENEIEKNMKLRDSGNLNFYVEKILDLLKSCNVDQKLIDPVILAYSSKNCQEISTTVPLTDNTENDERKFDKKLIIRLSKSDSPNDSETKNRNKNQQSIRFLGHNIDTMTPIKLKGSVLNQLSESISPQPSGSKKAENDNDVTFIVNTPYKFDAKKLTEAQKEKLSRRRDDIPAMYEDLSQSQTQDFSSNSGLEFAKADQTKDEDSTKKELTLSNPFTALILQQSEIINNTDNHKSFETGSDLFVPKLRLKRVRQSKPGNVSTSSDSESPEKKKFKRKSKSFESLVADVNTKFEENIVDKVKIGRKRRKSILKSSDYAMSASDMTKNQESDISNNSIGSMLSESLSDVDDIPIKLRIRRRKREFSVKLGNSSNIFSENSDNTSELNNTNSINSERKSNFTVNLLNTAQMKINSTDLNSTNNENMSTKKRGYTRRSRQSKTGDEILNENSVIENSEEPQNKIQIKTNIEKKQLTEKDQDEINTAKQLRIQRELQKIKIDIKNSEEYHVDTEKKRRTRKSLTLKSRVNNSELKSKKGEKKPKDSPKLEQGLKENPQEAALPETVIDDSQVLEEEINIKPFKLPVLYKFNEVKPGKQIVINTGNAKVDVVKGPSPTSPFKILKTVITPPDASKCKKLSFSADNNEIVKKTNVGTDKNVAPEKKVEIIANVLIKSPLKDFEEFESKISTETETIISETLSEFNKEDNLEEPEKYDKMCRKVLFDTSTEQSVNTEEKLLLVEEEKTNLQNIKEKITSSPISTDTPTRNKELLRNTCNISPIKSLNFDDDATMDECKVTETLKVDKLDSFELFNCEPSGSNSKSEELPERVKGGSPHPLKFQRKKNSFEISGGRSAQMMNMISIKSTLFNSNSGKKSEETKPEKMFSPPHNRILKMFEHLEKPEVQENNNEEVDEVQLRDEDFLILSKELPSPSALPSRSILRKKELEDSDETVLNICKRKRVHFKDPLVCHTYIEKSFRRRYMSNLDHKDTRSTRLRNLNGKSRDIVVSTDEKNESDDQSIKVNYDNTLPIFEFLAGNTESIDTLIPFITSLDSENKESLKMFTTIKTIGDLAKLTEHEISELPLDVGTIKTAFSKYISKFIETPVDNSGSLFSSVTTENDNMPSTSQTGLNQEIVTSFITLLNKEGVDPRPIIKQCSMNIKDFLKMTLVANVDNLDEVVSFIADNKDCLQQIECKKLSHAFFELNKHREFSENLSLMLDKNQSDNGEKSIEQLEGDNYSGLNVLIKKLSTPKLFDIFYREMQEREGK